MTPMEALELASQELVALSYAIGSNPANWIGPNAELHPDLEQRAGRLRAAAQLLQAGVARLPALERVAEATCQVLLFAYPVIVDYIGDEVETLLAALSDLAALDSEKEEGRDGLDNKRNALDSRTSERE